MNLKIVLYRFKIACCLMIFLVPLSSFSQGDKNQIVLNLADSTFIYDHIYNAKAGEDLGYSYHSFGKLIAKGDTIILQSAMPTNDFLPRHVHQLSTKEIEKSGFSYIYPIQENVDSNYVKIYFDNISNPENYTAFEYDAGSFKKLEIAEYHKFTDGQIKIIKTEHSSFRLIHYLTIRKPKNNNLVLFTNNHENKTESYLFDLNKIRHTVFHFFTRVYSNYYDFSGLKILKNGNAYTLLNDVTKPRYNNTLYDVKILIKE